MNKEIIVPVLVKGSVFEHRFELVPVIVDRFGLGPAEIITIHHHR